MAAGSAAAEPGKLAVEAVAKPVAVAAALVDSLGVLAAGRTLDTRVAVDVVAARIAAEEAIGHTLGSRA